MIHIKHSKQFFNRFPYTSKLVKKKKKKRKKEKLDCVLFLEPALWCDEICYLKCCEVDSRDVIENNKFFLCCKSGHEVPSHFSRFLSDFGISSFIVNFVLKGFGMFEPTQIRQFILF